MTATYELRRLAPESIAEITCPICGKRFHLAPGNLLPVPNAPGVNCLPHRAQAMTNSNGMGHSRELIHGTGATGRHGKMLMNWVCVSVLL